MCHRQAEPKMYKTETIFLPKHVSSLLGLIFVNGNILLCKVKPGSHLNSPFSPNSTATSVPDTFQLTLLTMS